MVIDPRKMRPGELCRLLNSTPLGEVTNERKMRRHRSRAGFRIGDGKHVDLLRYVGWLLQNRHAVPEETGDPYEVVKERARARNAALSVAGRDIGELPKVGRPRVKKRAGQDFRYFCDKYFPQTFFLPWSPDHIKVIDKIEAAVLAGGLFSLAMPRGSGKTTLCETAALWAMLYGHRQFICLIGSSEEAAGQMLDSIKSELETNELLAESFPEAVHPIACLDGIAHRANGQLFQGRRTHINWTAKELVLPTIPGSPSSGSVVRCCGITGRIRGMKAARADGGSARPDIVIIDDPQTDESARSPSQCRTREAVLVGAILGLAGPGKKMAGVMPCTIISPGDMAERILDRDKYPVWQGEKTQLIYQWPTATALWDEYSEIRADDFRNDGDGAKATAFYKKHKKKMDKGAVVAWPERYNPDELSALQHAVNLRLRDERAFMAEYQNDPVANTEAADLLTVDEIATKINGLGRYQVPTDAELLSGFIDIQKTVLYYVVVAWTPNFTGYVVDYGCEPEQRMSYFTMGQIRRTLAKAAPGAGMEGAIFSGLERLADRLLDRVYTRDDGAELALPLVLIDANWGATTDLVHQFCRHAKYRGRVMPAHGRYVGAASRSFTEYRKHRGDRTGHYWRTPSIKGKRAVRHVLFDSNYWKSFVHARMAQVFGDPGALTLWKAKPAKHQMYAEQMHSEYRIRTEGRGRVVDEWRHRPDRPDNHFFDCITGAAVAASMLGSELLRISEAARGGPKPTKDESTTRKKQRSKVSYLS